MEQKLYQKLISEVAELELPKLSETDIREAKKKAVGRGRPSNEALYEQEHFEQFLEIYGGVNPTAPPELTKLKISAVDCEDCGRHCENGRHTEKKLYEANKKKHWREKCVTCNQFKNPYTGKFDLHSNLAAIKWNAFLRDTKGAYKTARNQALEENNVIIRKYPDTDKPL